MRSRCPELPRCPSFGVSQHSQQGWVSFTCLCSGLPAQPQHHGARGTPVPPLCQCNCISCRGRRACPQRATELTCVWRTTQPLPWEPAAEWEVNCAGSEYKTSELRVLRDSCTQWHHGESQHEGTESNSDLLGQRDASVSMFGDMHLYCRLSLPLTETSFFCWMKCHPNHLRSFLWLWLDG